jgi:hypothetical protein
MSEFKAGQKLRIKEVAGLPRDFGKGEIVLVDHLEYVGGGAFAHIKKLDGSKLSGGWSVVRFEAVPEEKPAPAPTFKKGQKLKLVDDKGGGIEHQGIKLGDIVEALEDSYEQSADEFVNTLAKNGKTREYFVSRFEAVPEAAPAADEFEKTIYFSVETGYSTDLYEFDEGEEVAVYQLARVGTLKEHAPTVE